MVRDILQSIHGVEVFPIIALVLFIVIFLAIVIWTIRLDKSHIDKMSYLPLESTTPGQIKKQQDL